MPTISTFFGIFIRMYLADHPPPHFHVAYQGMEAKIEIESLRVMEGRLPRRQLELVRRWAEAHRDELRANWALVERREALNPIEPLE
jgi:Domain of unknown function (DUF4160)